MDASLVKEMETKTWLIVVLRVLEAAIAGALAVLTARVAAQPDAAALVGEAARKLSGL